MHLFKPSPRYKSNPQTFKQGLIALSAVLGAVIISFSAIPSAQALSFAPGTEFLPYKNKRACLRNGGNFMRWQGETYCTRAARRPDPRPKVTSYRSCVRAGGNVVKAKPPICLWRGRYFTQEIDKPRVDSKPIIIRNYKECSAYNGHIQTSFPQRCTILGRTFYKKGRFRTQKRSFINPIQGGEN